MNRTGLAGKLLAVSILLPAFAGLCAAGDETCVQEKIRLQKQETEQCSGFSYIFNPSACFNTRKTLDATSKACPGNPLFNPLVQNVDSSNVSLQPQEKSQTIRVTPAENRDVNQEIARLKGDVSQLREELRQLRDELSACRCSKR